LKSVYLGERVVAKVLEGRAELGRGEVAGAILVDGVEEGEVGLIGGLRALVLLGHQGAESLVIQRLGGEFDAVGQRGVVEELLSALAGGEGGEGMLIKL